MYWLADSWEKIKPETMKNSWHNILITKDLKDSNKKNKKFKSSLKLKILFRNYPTVKR